MSRLALVVTILLSTSLAACVADPAPDPDPSGSPSHPQSGLAGGLPTTPSGEPLEIDLPYDIKMVLGETYQPVFDAFAEKGAVPLYVTVDMAGATWRADELRDGTPFTITEADCTHEGNRDVGRDRVEVTWEDADGARSTDHLDLRYCED